jgi:molybdate transport system substrate-binding protein
MRRSLMYSLISITLATLGLAPFPGLAKAGPKNLTVYGAASLIDAFLEVGHVMEQRHPGLTVRFNFAGSQQLAAQLEQGAQADVFVSADQRWMDHVREHGLVKGESPVFARNRLVVIVPRGNPAQVARLEDLARRGIKLVLAAGAVPAGKYSREALEKLATAPGFPDQYQQRVLANVVSEEESVKSVVAKVQLGEADAGLVYRSDVTPAVSPRVQEFEIPDQYNVLASYPVAVLQSSRNPGAARQFLELLLSDEGQGVLQRHGLMPAAGRTASAGQH